MPRLGRERVADASPAEKGWTVEVRQDTRIPPDDLAKKPRIGLWSLRRREGRPQPGDQRGCPTVAPEAHHQSASNRTWEKRGRHTRTEWPCETDSSRLFAPENNT